MSKQPDWEEGPQDATHWCAESDQFLESWYKLDERGSWFCIAAGSWKWCQPSWYGLGSQPPRTGETLISRHDQSGA